MLAGRVARLRGAWVSWLSSRWAPVWAAGLAALLASPSLGAPVVGEDALLLAGLRGQWGERAWWDGFALSASGAGVEGLRDLGLLPWWTPQDASLSALRPLASATHALDLWLWPDAPGLMRAHNLAWYALAAGVGAWGLGRALRGLGASAWVAGLAGLLWALDDGHAGAGAALAGRHMAMAATFGALALEAHVRGGRWGWAWCLCALGCAEQAWPLLFLAPIYNVGTRPPTSAPSAAPAALVSSEASPSEGWRGWAWPAWAWVGAFAAWGLAWWGLGYGSWGLGLRASWGEWPEAAWGSRLGASVLGLWGLVPSDLWLLVPREGRWGLVGIAAGFLAWVLPSLWALLRVHRAARWLALVSLGGIAASAWGVPADRALFVAGLGSWPVIALWLGAWRERPAWWPTSGWRGKRAAGLAAGWALVHGVVAPSLLPLRAVSHGFLGESFGRLAAWLPDDPALPSQTLVVLRGPDALSAGAVPALRGLEGRPAPKRVRVLSVEPGGFEVRRVGPQSVELVRPEGFGENPSVELLGPPWGEAWAAGRWEVEGLRVEVVERAPDASAAPTRLRFAWSTPWERLRWVVWTDEGWAQVEPPQAGRAAQVPPMDARRVFER